MKRIAQAAVLLGLSAFGCGDDDAGSGGGDEGGGTTSTSTTASTGAQTGTSTSTTGSGGGPDDRIDPIALGHSWTYDVTEVGTFPLCPSGSQTAETVAEVEKNGKTGLEVTSLCANAQSSIYAVEGDVVFVDYLDTWVLALDAPVEEGHTWSNGISTFTWHDEGTVTVPAGTFDDCWRATQNVAYEAYTIFCRGVGPVHWHSVDLAGNGFDAILTAKSF